MQRGRPRMSPDEMRDAGLWPGKQPDLIVEGRVFDVYSPVTDQVATAHMAIAEKVRERQAHRIVVNLGGSNITRAELERELKAHPIPDLREVITIDHQGRRGHAYP